MFFFGQLLKKEGFLIIIKKKMFKNIIKYIKKTKHNGFKNICLFLKYIISVIPLFPSFYFKKEGKKRDKKRDFFGHVQNFK